MNIILISTSHLPELLLQVESFVCVQARLQGHDIKRLPASIDSLSTIFPSAIYDVRASDTEIDPILREFVTEFRANIAVVLSDASHQPKVAKALENRLHNYLVTYTLHVAADDILHLKNQSTGKNFKLHPDEAEKLINIISSEAKSVCRISSDGIEPTSDIFNDLARAEIGLRTYVATLPHRNDELRRPPRKVFSGALESVTDQEIVHGSDLWVKGWIDWDEKKCTAIKVTLDDTEIVIKPAGFRTDKFNPENCKNPLSFSTMVSLAGVYTSARLKIEVETSNGFVYEWISYQLWISQGELAAGTTPLVTGLAKFNSPTQVIANFNTDGALTTHLSCWQRGKCIGRREIEPSSISSDLTIDIVPEAEGLIFVHLHLQGLGAIPWVSLCPKSMRRIDASTHAGQHVIDNDMLEADLDRPLEQFPIQLFLDGKLHTTLPAPDKIEIDLSRQAGLSVLEEIGSDGAIATSAIWRQCSDPFTNRLPAIVLPYGTEPSGNTGSQREVPHVLLIRQTSAPTDELYIMGALDQLCREGAIHLDIVNLQDGEIEEAEQERLLSPGTAVIISRYLSKSWLAALCRRKQVLGGIFYLMDDDVTLAESDVRMPGGYRKRMMRVAHSEFQTLLHIATRFIVTAEFLLERFASDKTDLITPPYIQPVRNLDHLNEMDEIRIEYHGTQVHRADLDAIAAPLLWIHDNFPNVKIRTYMGSFAPSRFRGKSRIEIVPDIPWNDYKKAVLNSPAHIALAPMLETPYNKGKSFVKFMDISRLGAVGLYSNREPYTKIVNSGIDGFLLENDPLIWQYTITWLLNNPSRIKEMAISAQNKAAHVGNIEHIQEYWNTQLRHLF